jgi:hypothetical protein
MTLNFPGDDDNPQMAILYVALDAGSKRRKPNHHICHHSSTLLGGVIFPGH